jgi:hypothetical protein
MLHRASVDFVESLSRDGSGLRVEFIQQADRYAHRIVLAGDGTILLRSDETPEAPRGTAWPVLQSLHIHKRPRDGVAVAALVGKSGGNHWSLSVEPDPQSPTPRLIFDAACRVASSPTSLVSRYRADRSPPSVRIEPLPIDGEPALATVAADPAQLSFVVSRAPTADDAAPTTLRWRYAVSLI